MSTFVPSFWCSNYQLDTLQPIWSEYSPGPRYHKGPDSVMYNRIRTFMISDGCYHCVNTMVTSVLLCESITVFECQTQRFTEVFQRIISKIVLICFLVKIQIILFAFYQAFFIFLVKIPLTNDLYFMFKYREFINN